MCSAGECSQNFVGALTGLYLRYGGRTRASFSSQGPTADGRIKPDVIAPGMDIVSARAAGPDARFYGDFDCGFGTTTTGAAPWPSQTSLVYTGFGLDFFSAEFQMNFLEPTLVTTVTITLQAATATGRYMIRLIPLNAQEGPAPIFFNVNAPLSTENSFPQPVITSSPPARSSSFFSTSQRAAPPPYSATPRRLRTPRALAA